MLDIIEHGPIQELRLARAPANAINPELTVALTRALESAGHASRAVVVSGQPGMFSAGLDVPELLEFSRDQLSQFWQSFLNLLRVIATMPVPTAFAMTGHAPAGGLMITLFGDYRIMAGGQYKTGLNAVQNGLAAPPLVHQALVRLVGPHRAERMLMAGGTMEAQRAFEIGLVDELVDEPGQAVPRAIDWCEGLLALPEAAMATTRAISRSDLHRSFQNSSEFGVEKFIDVWFQESSQLRLRALAERLRRS